MPLGLVLWLAQRRHISYNDKHRQANDKYWLAKGKNLAAAVEPSVRSNNGWFLGSACVLFPWKGLSSLLKLAGGLLLRSCYL